MSDVTLQRHNGWCGCSPMLVFFWADVDVENPALWPGLVASLDHSVAMSGQFWTSRCYLQNIQLYVLSQTSPTIFRVLHFGQKNFFLFPFNPLIQCGGGIVSPLFGRSLAQKFFMLNKKFSKIISVLKLCWGVSSKELLYTSNLWVSRPNLEARM
jgi:hypothetical protein